MTVEHLYDVYWEAPQPLEKAVAEPGHVLYQLTGTHLVYGSDTLLYIGKTVRPNAWKRLSEHLAAWARKEADAVTVRLASVGVFEDWSKWTASKAARYASPVDAYLIQAIESLLIYVHQPSYNNHLKMRPRALAEEHFSIFNTGMYGRLLPELSTRRYMDVYRVPDDLG